MTFCTNKGCAKYPTCYRNYDKAVAERDKSKDAFVRRLPICVSEFRLCEEKKEEGAKN